MLVNNAGVLHIGSLLEQTDDEIDANFTTNFYGTLNVIREFLPALQRDGAFAFGHQVDADNLVGVRRRHRGDEQPETHADECEGQPSPIPVCQRGYRRHRVNR